MPTRDMVAVLAYIRGGMAQLPYNKRKVSNYSNSINRELTNNDMMQVLEWFTQKRNENPGFYHSMDLDKNNKVRSVCNTPTLICNLVYLSKVQKNQGEQKLFKFCLCCHVFA
jgi:hypothetical protein